MFKRVEKKLAKKKKEEELGITEEVKEAIGLNDVDSDDSTSDESEASSSSSTPKIPSKRKRPFEEESDETSNAASEGNDSVVSDDAEDDGDGSGVQMTVEEALHNPLYIVSIQPDIRGCIVCPQKTLKNDTMASVHTISQAHQRRISKFKEAAASAKLDDDAQKILAVAFTSTPLRPKPHSDDSAPLSKRATKRIAKFEKMKVKRQKHKAGKARSIAARSVKKPEVDTDSESETSNAAPTAALPMKRKLDKPSSARKLINQRPSPTKRKPGAASDKKSSEHEGRPSKDSKATDAKANPKSKRA